MWKAIAIWLACIVIGAAVGFLAGWLLFQAGFEIIGSTIAMVGAGFGGIIVLFLYLRRSEAF